MIPNSSSYIKKKKKDETKTRLGSFVLGTGAYIILYSPPFSWGGRCDLEGAEFLLQSVSLNSAGVQCSR